LDSPKMGKRRATPWKMRPHVSCIKPQWGEIDNRTWHGSLIFYAALSGLLIFQPIRYYQGVALR